MPPERLDDAVRGLAAAGLAGANVTIPHKRAAALLCDEADGDSVNTLVFADGRILGFNTDKEIVAGIDAKRVCLIGAGGSAAALLPGLRGEVRQFSRRGAWPPDATGCDLIVNATPVRDELLVEPHAGQTVVDLAYAAGARDRARRGRARRRLRRSSTGARRSSARAPRASSSGRARLRPSSVMRAALGLPT